MERCHGPLQEHHASGPRPACLPVGGTTARRWRPARPPVRQFESNCQSGFVSPASFRPCEISSVNSAGKFTIIYESRICVSGPNGLHNTPTPQKQNRRGQSGPFAMFTTPTSRWRALQTRDPSASTAFIYAVTTTRIYCRPTCPSRLARRANVIFFDTASQAARAGFRPCRRCGPADALEPSTRGRHEELVWAACAEMEARGGDVDFKTLAGGVGLSARYFHGVFKRVVGVTPGVYAEGLRAAREETMGVMSGWEEGGLLTEEETLRALGEHSTLDLGCSELLRLLTVLEHLWMVLWASWVSSAMMTGLCALRVLKTPTGFHPHYRTWLLRD